MDRPAPSVWQLPERPMGREISAALSLAAVAVSGPSQRGQQEAETRACSCWTVAG
jgi:hypothetical protein